MSLKRYLESVEVQGAGQVVGTPRYMTLGDLRSVGSKGKADVDARPAGTPKLVTDKHRVARAVLDEAEVSGVDKLHHALNEGGISDDEIKAGIELTEEGCHKVAAALGIAPNEVPALVNALIAQLTTDDKRLEEAYRATLAESDRYAYEADINSNVTIRDAQSGHSIYVQGTEGANLLARLRKAPDTQPILAGAMALNAPSQQRSGLDEAVAKPRVNITKSKAGHYTVTVRVDGKSPRSVAKLSSLDRAKIEGERLAAEMLAEGQDASEAGGYDAEIEADRGSYNMPWALDGQHGTMTVLYGVEHDRPALDIASVRDQNGEEFEPNPEQHRDLMVQARAFIGKE